MTETLAVSVVWAAAALAGVAVVASVIVACRSIRMLEQYRNQWGAASAFDRRGGCRQTDQYVHEALADASSEGREVSVGVQPDTAPDAPRKQDDEPDDEPDEVFLSEALGEALR